MGIQVPYRVRFANSMNRLFVAKYRIERRRSGEVAQVMKREEWDVPSFVVRRWLGIKKFKSVIVIGDFRSSKFLDSHKS